MKNHNEMYQSLLSRYDEYQEKKSRRRLIVKRTVPVLACFCFSVILGFGFWKHRSIKPPTASVAVTEETTASSASIKSTQTTCHQTEQRSTNIAAATGAATVSTQVNVATSEAELQYQTPTETAPTAVVIETKTAATEPTTSITTSEPSGHSLTEQPPDEGTTEPSEYIPWDEMTVNQQYIMAELGEPRTFYSTAKAEVSEDEVGEYIGRAYMSGYDWLGEVYYHCETDAYRVTGDDDRKKIAVRFEGDERYYLYTTKKTNSEKQLTG